MCTAGLTGKEARTTFIYSCNLVLKPEVGARPRESLNDLPAAKSLFFSVVFPNSHVLWTGKGAPGDERPGAGKARVVGKVHIVKASIFPLKLCDPG